MMMLQVNSNHLIAGIIGMSGLVIGVYVFMIKHLSNAQRHPDRKELVTRELCLSEQKTIVANLDSIKETANERHIDIKKDLAEIKNMIRDNGKI